MRCSPPGWPSSLAPRRLSTSECSDLNTQEVADLTKQRWGEILHPTIDDIVLMVVGLVRDSPELSMEDVDMWKTDLRGAYTLMPFKASSCMKFAIELVNGVTIIFCAGCSAGRRLPLPSRSSRGQFCSS